MSKDTECEKSVYRFVPKTSPLNIFTERDMDIAYEVSHCDPGFCQGARWQHARDVEQFRAKLKEAFIKLDYARGVDEMVYMIDLERELFGDLNGL